MIKTSSLFKLSKYFAATKSRSGASVFFNKNVTFNRSFSDSSYGGSITYSGGQANQGQGGFYGSGGSRAAGSGAPTHHPEAVARQTDITLLTAIMKDVMTLESEMITLQRENKQLSSRALEIKSIIRKTIHNPNVGDVLKRLEIKGEPVWGLSSKERDLVREVKNKYNSS